MPKKIKDLEFRRDGEIATREEIEEFTLGVEGWDHEEGFRIPEITVNPRGVVTKGSRWIAGLSDLQDWLHDEDMDEVDEFHNILGALEGLKIHVDEVNPDQKNARWHSDRNLLSIKNSLKNLGQHQPIVVQKQGMVVRVGNARLQAAKELGWTHIAALVVDEDDVQATARAIADNRTGELASWDFEMLTESLESLREAEYDVELVGFDKIDIPATNWDEFESYEEMKTARKDEIAQQRGEASEDIEPEEEDEEVYSKKIEAPIYEPKEEEPPALWDLYDNTKTQSLIQQIDESDLDEQVKSFLREAAHRHTVFNFSKIAEFYAHQPAEIQRHMENSALVIIDFDRAIENGFVMLSKRLQAIYQSEPSNEE